MPIIIKANKISPFFESFYPFKDIKILIQNIHTNSPLLKLFLSLTSSLIVSRIDITRKLTLINTRV